MTTNETARELYELKLPEACLDRIVQSLGRYFFQDRNSMIMTLTLGGWGGVKVVEAS